MIHRTTARQNHDRHVIIVHPADTVHRPVTAGCRENVIRSEHIGTAADEKNGRTWQETPALISLTLSLALGHMADWPELRSKGSDHGLPLGVIPSTSGMQYMCSWRCLS